MLAMLKNFIANQNAVFCCRAGDCAVASSFVSYLGPFNKEFREQLLAREFAAGCKRLSIPHTRDLHVSQFLADDSEIGEWTLQVLAPSATAAFLKSYSMIPQTSLLCMYVASLCSLLRWFCPALMAEWVQGCVSVLSGV